LGDQPQREQYLEVVARQAALSRVLQHLQDAAPRLQVEPEFYWCQETLVTGEMNQLQGEIDRLKEEHPDLQDFTYEQLQAELLAIEADDTYAEFVRAGRLNRELAPVLPAMQVASDAE